MSSPSNLEAITKPICQQQNERVTEWQPEAQIFSSLVERLQKVTVLNHLPKKILHTPKCRPWQREHVFQHKALWESADE